MICVGSSESTESRACTSTYRMVPYIRRSSTSTFIVFHRLITLATGKIITTLPALAVACVRLTGTVADTLLLIEALLKADH